ncbi:MAG: 30S ribosomal protein S5 [Armatimonadota bacterium]
MARRAVRIVGKRPNSTQPGREQTGPQLDVRVIRCNKVSKTLKGGKTMSWSVLVCVGDNKGSVGVGLGKARGVPDAIRKAEEGARKNMDKIEMIGSTIPHAVEGRHGSARVILRPASPGTGVKAGSAVRMIVEAAGVHNILSKCLGSRNLVNIAYATLDAFNKLQAPERAAAIRGSDVNTLVPWLAKARKEEADHA